MREAPEGGNQACSSLAVRDTGGIGSAEEGRKSMTETQASCLILQYPARWDLIQELREQIIEASGNGEAYCKAATGSGHSDNTFKKTARLALLAEEESILGVIREWLANGLDPEDRIFLIGFWRGKTLAEMDRDAGRIGAAWRSLQRMTKGLSLFAGHACGGPGPACAGIQGKPRPES